MPDLQERALDLDIHALSDDDVAEWLMRLQSSTFGGDVCAARCYLEAEKARLLERTGTTDIASQAVACASDQGAAF